MPWTGQQRPTTVHIFVVGDHSEDVDYVELRITASADYRVGRVPADPVLEQAATFGSQPSTPPAVYVTNGHGEPEHWACFDDVVALPATDGSPVLRFRASGDGALPSAFREAAKRTHRVVLAETGIDPRSARPTVILLAPAAHSS